MHSGSILQVQNLNKDIAGLRKDSFNFGLLVENYIVASKSDSAVYTASAIEACTEFKSCVVIFQSPQFDNSEDDYFYLLIKHNNEFIYEYFGALSDLNVAALKGAFETILRDKKQIHVLSNFDKEEHEDCFSIGAFELPKNSKFKSVDLELTSLVNLKSLRVSSRYLNLKYFVGILILSAIAFFALYEKEQSKPVNTVPKIVKKEVSYKALQQFYTKNSVESYSQLIALYRQINKVNLVSGWSVIGAYLTRDEKSGELIEILELDSSYGEMKAIQPFITENGYSVDIQNNKAILSRIIKKNSVYVNYARFHVGSYQKWLSSNFSYFFDDVDIKSRDLKVETSESNVVFKENTITIPALYFDDIVSIAGALRGSPYSLEEVKFIKSNTSNSFIFTLTLVIAGVTDGK
jgi:hypothetical protein|tara:strand:- start:13766 stop:14983 length:1218 start_codon:yes stop_codon:yes gene_type:complete